MHFVGTGMKVEALNLEEVLANAGFMTRFDGDNGRVRLITGTQKAPIRTFDCERGTHVSIRRGERICTAEDKDDPELRMFNVLEECSLVTRTHASARRSSSNCTIPPLEADLNT